MQFIARQFEFTFPRPALVMGVLNVTPDSFSDGGEFFDPDAAVPRAFKLAADGAGLIDIGGESTRPGAVPVTEAEELRRVMPVLEQLSGRLTIPISIDTMKVEVARRALAAGASIVNDVAANREDRSIWELVAESGAGYVCMHMQGTPQTMQINPVYSNVLEEVTRFFGERLAVIQKCGVRPEQIILDPGIGFGKRMEHNMLLLGSLKDFARFSRPVLVGVSRKSFLGRTSGGLPQARLPAGLACACLAVEAGVQMIRAHDVQETVEAIRMTEAIIASRKH
ncbi:MAG TPA: dihydropteroate synthase [Candidatus Limnocylindrales bacterium]|nr:dihydropteroate synthase [Candidatus Limnocylindrales bacterium]